VNSFEHMILFILATTKTEETHNMELIHRDLHSGGLPINGFNLNDKCRDLCCPVCCGLPPWQWDGMFSASVKVTPRMEKDYHWVNKTMVWNKKFRVDFTAFNWRTERTWGWIDKPFGECSQCHKWGQVANHKIPTPYIKCDGEPYKDIKRWNKLHVCLKCIKSENKSISKLNQAKEVKRLIRELKKLAKGA